VGVEYISTTLIAAIATPPAGAYDLTTLATVHDELSLATGDTSNDTFLSRAISQASRAISRYCGRVFPIEAVEDQIYIEQDPYPWQTPGGVYPLQLSRWPLLDDVIPVTFTGNTNGTTDVTGISDMAGIAEGMLIFAADGSIPPGTTVTSVGSGSLVLSNAATSNETGLSMTVGVQVIQTLSVGETQSLVYGSDYTIDFQRGWLIRLNEWTGVSEKWEAEPVNVQYQAGYFSSTLLQSGTDNVPEDLEEACLRLVTARFKARGRDPMLVEQSQPQALGTQRWWIGQMPGQNGALPPEIEAMVRPYRVPVVA
jgi:hypothetical protein